MSDQKNEHAHIFKFKYQNQKSALESVKIKVHEAADEEYGTYAWPSSLLLAQYLAEQHLDYQNRSLLELGCGIALPGLVAAKLGARVVLTDAAAHVKVLQNCKRSCDLNQIHCEIIPLSWGSFSSQILTMSRPDYLIAADVFYEQDKIDILLSSIVYFGAPLLTAFHRRDSRLRSRLTLACKAWDLELNTVSLPPLTKDWYEKQLEQSGTQLELLRISSSNRPH